MMRRAGVHFIAIFLVLLCMPLHAQAGNSVRPYAPWLSFRDGLDESIRKPEVLARTPNTKAFTSGKPLPEKPVMTPRDTMDVMNQLYGQEPHRLSALEEEYSRRIIDEVRQFGYDQFGAPEKDKGKKDEKKSDAAAMPAGAVQDDFVLNSGDTLRVTFRGQRQDSKLYNISSQGQLLIDDLPPVSAAGRTIAELRGEVQAQAAKLHNTEVYLSLEAVRQINVVVVGHVAHPGRQTLTVFGTVLDALTGAGGIQKTGSLRQVRLVRDGRSTIIDLYGLLVHSTTIMDLALRDGDRLIIPPVGPTVAVAGGVKRPGIYEIQPDLRGANASAEKLSLDDLLDMAGGLLTPGSNRYIRLGLTRDGRETVTEITNPLAHVFSDGSILKVEPAVEARTGTVELAGHTRKPGIYELNRTASLSSLINSSKVFGKDAYPLIGVIERRDETQQAKEMIAFPPLQVVKGRFDRRLHDGDVVYLFSRRQILSLQKDEKGKVAEHQRATGSKEGDDEEEIPEYGSAMHGPDEYAGPITDADMQSFLRERSAFIRGAVRQEGAWPVADGATLENVVAAAGGLTLEASTDDIEVTSRVAGFGAQDKGRGAVKRYNVNYGKTDPADVVIKPGDSVRVKQKFLRVADDSVLVVGEVASPGRYDLSPGDHLSDLLKRAGGLTPHAYPQGAIFSRESERRAEESRFRAQAQELEAGLAATLAGGKNKDDGVEQSQIGAAQELIGELKNAEAVGRITVQADPGMLASRPEQDILLESGDRVFIPKRPLTVRVAGEVMSPAALAFRKDKDAAEYITEAGGFTYNADKERAFVVYPDGSAQPLHVSMWNHSATMIPPGSTVIVPRDPKPFDFIQTARDVSQILSNLAITGIFIDDIRRNR